MRTFLNFLLSFVAIGFSVAAIEVTCFAFFKPSGDSSLERAEDEFLYALDEDLNLGHRLIPNKTHQAVLKRNDGELCYQATYHIDEYARRTVSQRYDANNRHLLLFGGSVTFGEGLDDADTLQHLLASRVPGFNIYNYAVHGYGPSHALAIIQKNQLPSEVLSDTGIALYILIPGHVSRVIGDTRAFWIYESPYYFLNNEDKVERKGSFLSGRPTLSKLYQAVLWLKTRSNLLTLLDTHIPLEISKKHLWLTARVLAEAKAGYTQQFNGKFFAVFHPTWDANAEQPTAEREALKQMLSQLNIEVLDFSDIVLGNQTMIHPPCDYHPNGQLNRELAHRISASLTSD